MLARRNLALQIMLMLEKVEYRRKWPRVSSPTWRAFNWPTTPSQKIREGTP